MSKTRIGRPASDIRLARRSLVELTAAASRAIDDGLLVTSAGLIAAPPDCPLPSAPAANDRGMVAPQVTAPTPVAVPESLKKVAARNGQLVGSDSTAEMLVEIAKDCHKRAFQDIKLALDLALDHAKNFAETRVGSEGAMKGDAGAMPQNNFLAILKGTAAEFRAEALEMMKANVITTVEYARELAGTRTAAEFVELSGTQARKQCELILKQAGSLRSLAQTKTKSSAAD
jgi:Phasin protein